MPHRVTNFLRNSSNSLENQVLNLKKATIRRNPSPTTSSRTSPSSDRLSSYASSIDDDADEAQHANMTTAQAPRSSAAMDKGDSHHQHHRISLPGLHFGRSSKESHSNPNLALECRIESPPIVLYGDADNSTGALVSGQLFLKVKEDGFHMQAFTAKLNVHVTQKRPFSAHCHECANQYTEVQKWSFLQSPLAMAKG